MYISISKDIDIYSISIFRTHRPENMLLRVCFIYRILLI